MTDLIERLRERASTIRGYIASSQIVVDLLAPEMAKFDARTEPCDSYTVRMSVDHQSSIRRQTKEAEDYEEAADRIAQLEAENTKLREQLAQTILQQDEEWQKAKLEIARLRRALTVLRNLPIVENDSPDTLHLDGAAHIGPVVDYLFRIVRKIKEVARAALQPEDRT